jgi:hypothetical protein
MLRLFIGNLLIFFFFLVLKAIREGFLKTQQDMWGDLENWTKVNKIATASPITV